MEEAMSHTGIRQFYLSLQRLWCVIFDIIFFPLTPAWAEIVSLPLIRPSMEELALNLWLHAGDDLTNHNCCVSFILFFFPSLAAAASIISTVILHSHPAATCCHPPIRIFSHLLESKNSCGMLQMWNWDSVPIWPSVPSGMATFSSGQVT